MNLTKLLGSGTAASPYVAALAYAGLVVVLAIVTVTSIKDVFDERAANAVLSDVALRLEGRTSADARAPTGDGVTTGSYFLEGATVTVAGAALLQRVVGTVTRHGGSVLSSQVDLLGTRSKEGFLTVTASCDMEQAALQQIIYDLEAGMPFLFVEQLDIQAAAGPANPVGGKLRVLLSVSGQWKGAR